MPSVTTPARSEISILGILIQISVAFDCGPDAVRPGDSQRCRQGSRLSQSIQIFDAKKVFIIPRHREFF